MTTDLTRFTQWARESPQRQYSALTGTPLSSNSSGVKEGRDLFENAGCQNCHGGASWTASILDFKPPPEAGEIFDSVNGQAQLIRFLCRVGTFDPNLFQPPGNEIRANNVANVQARGVDGFNILMLPFETC